jgi:hypothetical protein
MTLELLKTWSPTGYTFGGMPTYQLEPISYDYIGAIDDVFLPRLIICFYTLWVLWFIIGFKTDPLKAFFGALAFFLLI